MNATPPGAAPNDDREGAGGDVMPVSQPDVPPSLRAVVIVVIAANRLLRGAAVAAAAAADAAPAGEQCDDVEVGGHAPYWGFRADGVRRWDGDGGREGCGAAVGGSGGEGGQRRFEDTRYLVGFSAFCEKLLPSHLIRHRWQCSMVCALNAMYRR